MNIEKDLINKYYFTLNILGHGNNLSIFRGKAAYIDPPQIPIPHWRESRAMGAPVLSFFQLQIVADS